MSVGPLFSLRWLPQETGPTQSHVLLGVILSAKGDARQEQQQEQELLRGRQIGTMIMTSRAGQSLPHTPRKNHNEKGALCQCHITAVFLSLKKLD